MNKAVIIWGAPSSGKGTQAKLLSEKLGFFNFDTGDYLRKILFGHNIKDTKEIIARRNEYKSGALVNPPWLLKIISKEIKKLADLNESVVFSGSPRTLYEAFGDKNNKGVFDILNKEYGKKNINIFYINIPEKESMTRGSKRLICTVCKGSLLASDLKFKACPFCGGKLMKRVDDKPEIIKNRLKEYHEQTEPILKEAKKRGYTIHEIEGTAAPYKIHEKIASYFSKS